MLEQSITGNDSDLTRRDAEPPSRKTVAVKGGVREMPIDVGGIFSTIGYKCDVATPFRIRHIANRTQDGEFRA